MLVGRDCHVLDEKMEIEQGLVICSKSCRSQDLNLRLVDSRAGAFRNEPTLLYFRVAPRSVQTDPMERSSDKNGPKCQPTKAQVPPALSSWVASGTSF